MTLISMVGCGDSAPGVQTESADGAAAPVAECRTPSLGADSARPFDWLPVHELPAGFEPTAAEITTMTGTDTLLAPVVLDPAEPMLQVPIHPSFERRGGEVNVRIYSDADSCDPVSLVIEELPAAPGAMADATRELRAAMDAIVGRATGKDAGDVLAAELAASPGDLSIFAVAALWALPALEELERLVAGDSVATESAESGEMLDAIAGRLELPVRMQELHSLALVTRALVGELTLSHVLAAREANAGALERGRSRPASYIQFASHSPIDAPTARPVEACPEDQFNLFQIEDPAKLDNLMRAQHYSERFYAGAKDKEGGSASGTVFGDVGVVMGAIGMLGPQGKTAGKVWSAFSEVVLNTTEAYAGLLPGDMELAVVADPASFEEDSEETGRWTAGAVATSEGMRLTDKVIEKVMTKALEKGLGDASIGTPLSEQFRGSMPDGEFYDEVAKKAAKKIDKTAKKEASAAVKSLLKTLGAEEGPDWFDIPGGCWELGDMLAGGGSGGPAAGDPRAPALLTAHLTGPGVAWVNADADPPREYAPAEADSSRLEIRTVENYRKSVDLGRSGLDMITGEDGLRVGTTYAFGGEQHVAVTYIKVLPIEIELNPTIVRVEPGDTVPFVATVRNALDTRVRWHPSPMFDEIVDFGEGTHEAQLVTPTNPESFPIRVEVESVSRDGLRSDGEPERKAEAWVQVDDPVLAINPTRSCLAPGDTLRFAAELLGVVGGADASEGARIRWSSSGGRIRDGLFRAPESEGTYQVTATYADNPDMHATATIEVGANCCGFNAMVSAGPQAGPHQGPAWMLGTRGLFLADVSGKWETRVFLPDTEPGQYETEMEVVAHVPNPYEPGDTIGVSAAAPDGERTHPVTVVIERKEGEIKIGRGDGSIEGHLRGRAGWRRKGGDIFFELQASFKAVPYSVSPRGRFQQCREGWGLRSSGDMMRQFTE